MATIIHIQKNANMVWTNRYSRQKLIQSRLYRGGGGGKREDQGMISPPKKEMIPQINVTSAESGKEMLCV